MMLNDERKGRVYCQKCGKELLGTVDAGFTLCSECQISMYTTPSYLQTTFNKPPFSMLADESNYQHSWLHAHHADVVQDISKITDYKPTVLGGLPDASLGTVFTDIGALQQNILHPAILEKASINPIAHTIAEVSLKITDTMPSVIQTDNYLERITAPSYTGWLNQDNIIDRSVLSCSVPSQMISVLATSMAANNAFLSFDPSKLYEVPGVHRNLAELSMHSLNDLAGEYKSLSTDLYGHYDSLVEASSLVVERPPFEVYQAGILAEFIAPLEEPKVEEGLVKPKEIIRVPEGIREKILPLGKPFVRMYDGAVEAINIPLADSQRHACVSLRELVTHIINKLAPNEKTVQYLSTLGDVEEYWHQGKPTRQGRIRYICRIIDMDSFAKFMDTDVKSTLAFIDLLQEGTHSLEAHFSEKQLTALLSRAEGLLSFLIDVSNA